MQPQLNKRNKSLLTAFIFIFAAISISSSHASRNGVEQPTNSFAVGFTFKTNTGASDLCSGALISPTYILTAAHCVTDSSGNLYSDYFFTAPGIRLDAPFEAAKLAKISDVIFPTGYLKADTTEQSDLAFIKLDRPLAASGYIRIATSDEISKLANSSKLTGYGYGAVYETGETYSNLAKSYEIDWSNSDLGKFVSFELTSKDSVGCSGDSGGPITAKLSTGEEVLVAVLHGAASVVNRCGTSGQDGLYRMQITLINSYLPLVIADLKKSLNPPTATPTPTPTPKPTTSIKPKIYKITCLKGKTKKYVSGTAPKCPAGYKQIAKILISK